MDVRVCGKATVYFLWSRELFGRKSVDFPCAPSFMAKVILGIHCRDLVFEALHAPGPKLTVMWVRDHKPWDVFTV